MNHQERIENLNRHIDAGTLVRNEWGDGHERACLLAALSPESSQGQSPSVCPASVMPQWLAHLTPWMDDAGSKEAWPAMVRRYADLASRWRTLSDDQWSRLDFAARKIALESCLEHNKAACEPVLRLLDQSIAGDHVPAKDWDAAEEAARAAAYAAAYAAVDHITTKILDAIEAEIEKS